MPRPSGAPTRQPRPAAPEARTESGQEPRTIIREETTTETEAAERTEHRNWDIFGPIRLRAADPEELGEVEVKFLTEWGTSSSHEQDRVSIEPEIEYGIAVNRIGLDGDSIGDNYAIGITYIYVFRDVPHLGGNNTACK